MISYEYRSCNTAVKYKDKKYNVNSIPENFMTQGPVVNDIVNVIKDMSFKEPLSRLSVRVLLMKYTKRLWISILKK